MSGAHVFVHFAAISLGKLRRQTVLLAGLALLCAALPELAGRGAEAFFSQGADFSGFTLVITAPEDDPVPEVLADLLGAMTDVRQYCQVRAMDRSQALEDLQSGRASAVLVLPPDFIRAVQRGENPAVDLIVDGGRPLESLLASWVGQSAADLLSAVQRGVYWALEQWDEDSGVPWSQAVLEINLRYVRWTLGRQEIFRTETLLPTGTLPIALHYRLCLMGYLLLAMCPLFAWNYQGALLAPGRLRYVLRSPLYGYFASLTVCWGALALVALAALLPLDPPPLPALGAALFCGAFASAYAAFCALTARTAAGCGALSFFLTLLFLTAAGGVVPPVLLPEALRRLEALSPVAWMRDLTAWALGAGEAKGLLPLLGALALLTGLCALLYRRRAARGEAGA